MPLEIREVIIKARIDTGETRAESSLTPETLRALKEKVLQEAIERLEERVVERAQR
jgi:hypothetical protein